MKWFGFLVQSRPLTKSFKVSLKSIIIYYHQQLSLTVCRSFEWVIVKRRQFGNQCKTCQKCITNHNLTAPVWTNMHNYIDPINNNKPNMTLGLIAMTSLEKCYFYKPKLTLREGRARSRSCRTGPGCLSVWRGATRTHRPCSSPANITC